MKWFRRRKVTPPTEPEGVVHVNGLTGERTPCVLVYWGVDGEGLHDWHVMEPVLDASRGDSLCIEVLPARTSISGVGRA